MFCSIFFYLYILFLSFVSSGAVLTFDTYFHNNEWKLATGGSDGKLKLWDITLSTTPFPSDSLPQSEIKEVQEEDSNMLIES
jgi:WD40 repeat protein